MDMERPFTAPACSDPDMGGGTIQELGDSVPPIRKCGDIV